MDSHIHILDEEVPDLGGPIIGLAVVPPPFFLRRDLPTFFVMLVLSAFLSIAIRSGLKTNINAVCCKPKGVFQRDARRVESFNAAGSQLSSSPFGMWQG